MRIQFIQRLLLHRRIKNVIVAVIVSVFISFIYASLHTRKVTDLVVSESTPNETLVIKHTDTRKTSYADHEKMEFIKNMTLHGWNGYKKFAWGSDELMPKSKSAYNWTTPCMFLTALDAIDLLYIMDLKDEYKLVKKLIMEDLDFSIVSSVSLFETNIRVLGALLSMYDLTGDLPFILKAKDLADRFLPAFQTPTGIPINSIDLSGNQQIVQGGHASLAQSGTLQLEFQYLSDVLENSTYKDVVPFYICSFAKALHVYDQLLKIKSDEHLPLFPRTVRTDTLASSNCTESVDSLLVEYGIGAEQDSFYEYLLKLGLSMGSPKYKNIYHDTADVTSI